MSAPTPARSLAANQTPGLVCSHHHLYSALARGMPAPPRTPTGFQEILDLIWWRLDTALDLDLIEWSAKLGALEALAAGCTAIIDHHESPNAIDGSLSVIAEACAEVGVRVDCTYGVTDRHGPEGAKAGLAENERFLRDVARSEGGSRSGERRSKIKGRVGMHAAFTCSDETIEAAADLGRRLGVGVHVHVAEGENDTWQRLRGHTDDSWLLVHGVHLPDDHGLSGTIVHNPRSNMNNSVGYGRPARFSPDASGTGNPVALGTDGIGADMLDEFRVAFVKSREEDVTRGPDLAWSWVETGWDLFPEARNDRVTWNYADMDPWRLAYTTGLTPLIVQADPGDGGEPETLWADGGPTRVDGDEIRAKAAEAAQRLFTRLDG